MLQGNFLMNTKVHYFTEKLKSQMKCFSFKLFFLNDLFNF